MLVKTFVSIISHFTSIDQKNWNQTVPFATFVMNTARSEPTGYGPSEFTYGRTPTNQLNVAMGYNGSDEVPGISLFTATVQAWFAREIALEKVDRSHDKEAHSLMLRDRKLPNLEQT